MKDYTFPAGTRFLSIVENDNVKGYLASHLKDLITYLDEHGLDILGSNQANKNNCLYTVLAYSHQNDDNVMYYATRTYLDECGVNSNQLSMETSTIFPHFN
jgi:hypothetical protein